MIVEEIARFDEEFSLLLGFIDDLARLDEGDFEGKHFFLAEAVVFRMFRVVERLSRAAFLECCVVERSLNGIEIVSKLRCPDHDMAEEILKSGNRFLDWGDVVAVQKVAGLVFENGFPIRDFLSPVHSQLVDLKRFRNFVAHDSKEAREGFLKSRHQYLRVGDVAPESVGKLSVYRKSARDDITLKILHNKVSSLSSIIKAL